MQSIRRLTILSLMVGATAGVACSSESSGDQRPGIEGPAVYALTSNMWGTDGATGYLYTIDSVENGEPSLDGAIELSGGAWLTGREGLSSVYVSSGEGGPRITRWDVNAEGKLSEGPTISFERLGLTSGMRFGTAPIVSDTKAYLVDSQQHRIATWNPREMLVGKTIDLDLEPRDGLPVWIPSVTVRGDRLFVTAVWEDDSRFAPSSRVIAIDTNSDGIVSVEDEPRCEQLAITSTDSKGTVYYSPYAHASAARHVLGEEYGSRACALRIVPPEGSLDEAWEVDLSELADGRPAGEFILASDKIGYFRAFYNEDVGATRADWDDKQGVPGYRWWKWEIGAERAEEIPDQPLTVEAAHYPLDGKMYVGNPSADWSKTTAVGLRPDGELREGVRVTGTPGGIVRVR